jgi:multidrug efflux system outer membrane protein
LALFCSRPKKKLLSSNVYPVRTDVPAGLPSSLLERRPDIRAAERQLIAANADIGQAKAAFFPQSTVTGFYGFPSIALSDLFSNPAQTWQFGPAVSLPLFAGARLLRLLGNYEYSRARFEEAVALYQKPVQDAFRDVSDSLIAYKRVRELGVIQLYRALGGGWAAGNKTSAGK